MSATRAYAVAVRGEDLPWSKLTDERVRLIRAQHAAKERLKRELDARFSAAALAVEYGVAETTIQKVLSYATWRHVR